MIKTAEIGRAGELRVASELLLRGYRVHLSLVDSGSDLILDNGKKIQVKCCHNCPNPKQKCHRYVFAFKHWQGKKEGKRVQRYTGLASEVDFVILWCIDDNQFFVIPANKVLGRKTITIYTQQKHHRRKSWTEDYKNNWKLLEDSLRR